MSTIAIAGDCPISPPERTTEPASGDVTTAARAARGLEGRAPPPPRPPTRLRHGASAVSPAAAAAVAAAPAVAAPTPLAPSAKWGVHIFANTARVCTMLLLASAVLMALCLHIAAERRRLICLTHTGTVQTCVQVVVCSVDVLPVQAVQLQVGIAFTAATADTSSESARTSQCTVGGFTNCGLTLLGLS